jgi:acetylornithine deacetylase/succinyl-diaminopimelate desuccinylase-like protein
MMSDRKDALVTAAACIAGLPKLVAGAGSQYAVATIGRVHVFPNEINVVPGCCRFTLEIRDQDSAVIDRIREIFYDDLRQAASDRGISVDKKSLSRQAPSEMAAWIQNEIASACKICGYETMSLPSGAFHDALPMSARFPTGMIFVPSCGGISHSPSEFTDEYALDAGCQVLLQTVLNIDERRRRIL